MWLFSWSNMQLQVEKKPSFLSPTIGSIRNIYGKTQKKMVLSDNSFLTLKMEILNSLEQIDQIDNWVGVLRSLNKSLRVWIPRTLSLNSPTRIDFVLCVVCESQ